jgi:hypothetical protein
MAGLSLVPLARGGNRAGGRLAFWANETGRFIYERCDGKHTADQIASALAEQYEVTPRQAESQVQNYLEKLHRAGLVR